MRIGQSAAVPALALLLAASSASAVAAESTTSPPTQPAKAGHALTVRVTDGAAGHAPLAGRDVLLCEPHSQRCSQAATTDAHGLAHFTGVKNDQVRVSLFPDQDGGKIVDITHLDASTPIDLISPPTGTLRLVVEEQTPTGKKPVVLHELELVMWHAARAGHEHPFSYGKVVLRPSDDHYDAAVPADEAVDLELHLDGFDLVSSKGLTVPQNATKVVSLVASRKKTK